LSAVLTHAASKHLCIDLGPKGNERRGEAGRKRSLRLASHASLSACYFGGVSGKEVIHSLFRIEPRDGREHTKCVSGQKDDMFGMSANARDLRVIDEFHRISRSRVLRDALIVVIGDVRLRLEHNILQDSAKTQRIPDLWLPLL